MPHGISSHKDSSVNLIIFIIAITSSIFNLSTPLLFMYSRCDNNWSNVISLVIISRYLLVKTAPCGCRFDYLNLIS